MTSYLTLATIIILGFLMKKDLTVTIQEPLEAPYISIDISTIGWQTIRYRVYDQGTPHPDIIPTSANMYILRVSYKDSVSSSHVYIHSNETKSTDFSFNFSTQKNAILCKISSDAHWELNKTVQLKDIDTDKAELMEALTNKMKE